MTGNMIIVHLSFISVGVVEGDLAAIEAYKSSGGDIARQLTADEVRLLNRPSAFDVGYTLVHLAIRFQRQDMLAILLTEVSLHFARTCYVRVPLGSREKPDSNRVRRSSLIDQFIPWFFRSVCVWLLEH